ncbi:MAG: GNAT family N-acetyltransferase [Bacteroidota bacterium]
METTFQIPFKNDIPEILDMMQAFYAIDHYSFDRKISEQNLNEFLANETLGRLWMILQDAKIVGYIVLTFGYSFEYGGRDAFIDEFYIKAGYRNKGIGKQTMGFIEEHAKKLGVKAIHLEVESHNEKGNRLYVKQDYQGNNRSLLTKRINSV